MCRIVLRTYCFFGTYCFCNTYCFCSTNEPVAPVRCSEHRVVGLESQPFFIDLISAFNKCGRTIPYNVLSSFCSTKLGTAQQILLAKFGSSSNVQLLAPVMKIDCTLHMSPRSLASSES